MLLYIKKDKKEKQGNGRRERDKDRERERFVRFLMRPFSLIISTISNTFSISLWQMINRIPEAILQIIAIL